MAWVKLDDQFPDHRKLAELGDFAPLCGWLYVCGLAYCNRQLTDGRIPKLHVHRLASFRHISVETAHVGTREHPLASLGSDVMADDLAQRLVQAGLWEEDGDAYRVHDYEEYQLTRTEVESMREQRRAAGHRGGVAKAKRVARRVVKHAAKQVASEMPSDDSSKRVAKLCPVPDPDPSTDTSLRSVSVARDLDHQPDPPRLTTKPLGYRPRIDVAWPGRPPVPGALHAEFRDKLGGDPNEADRRLREWYPLAAREWDDKPIGDDDFRFWRARFAEWVGTTVRRVTPAEPTFDADAEAASYARIAERLKARGHK